MKLTVDKAQLIQSLNMISKGMSSRSTLPILSGIHLEAQGGGLTLRTTDLEVSIRHTIPVLIEAEGAAVVPGKLFFDITKSLPEAAISLSQEGDNLTIRCLDSIFTLHTLNPDDFPLFPLTVAQNSFQIPTDTFSSMVKKVIKAVSRDESRAVLTGVLLQINGPQLQMVATDSYRLAIAKALLNEAPTAGPAATAAEQTTTPTPTPADAPTTQNQNAPEQDEAQNEAQGEAPTPQETNQAKETDEPAPTKLIIPGAMLDEIRRLALSSKYLTISDSENQILFSFGDTTFVTRKIEGSYPNFEAIIPTEKSVTVTFETAVMLEAVKRAAITAQIHTPIRFSLDPDAQLITISSKTQDIATAQEQVNAQITGEALDIGFNHQYITDGLSSVDTEEVYFEAQSMLKPGILRSVGDDYFFYLTMPVRLDD
jgi:DNA polymerase-3 subunit beta